MKGSGNAGNTPFIVVEGHQDGPSTGRSDPAQTHGAPLFQGFDTPESIRNCDENGSEGGEGVSGKKSDLQLQQDQVADNPISPEHLSMHLEREHTEDAYEKGSGHSILHRRNEERTRPHPPNQPLSSAATHKLKKATHSMREGLKHASVNVAYAGEQMGKAWNRTLDSAMIVCAICGGLAIILVAVAVSLRSWRYQHLTYTNENGFNIARVDLGLRRLQRIQTLERLDHAGVVKAFDPSFYYQDVIDSPFCTPEDEAPPVTTSLPSESADSPPESSSRDSTPEKEPETTEEAEGEPQPSAVASAGFMSRMLQEIFEKPKERKGPLEKPPPFSVTVGRDPAAPGTLHERYIEMREMLLGSTVFDIQCAELRRFKNSGALFIRMIIAYFVAAGIGMLAAVLAMALAAREGYWSSILKRMPINLVGSVAWIGALVLQLCAIAAWGVGTDVAACVTSEGGAAVCNLGVAAGLSIGSLVLTLVATLSYCVFFTHKFIRDLGLEKERERRLREASERPDSVEMFHDSPLEGGPSYVPGEITFVAAQQVEGPSGNLRGGLKEENRDGPAAPKEGFHGGPHPQAKGETSSPIRSLSAVSHT